MEGVGSESEVAPIKCTVRMTFSAFSQESVIRIGHFGIPCMRKCCSNDRFSNGKFYRRYLWGRTVDWGWNPCGFSDLWVATKPKKLADVQLREWHGLFLLKCDRYLSWFSILVFIFSSFLQEKIQESGRTLYDRKHYVDVINKVKCFDFRHL